MKVSQGEPALGLGFRHRLQMGFMMKLEAKHVWRYCLPFTAGGILCSFGLSEKKKCLSLISMVWQREISRAEDRRILGGDGAAWTERERIGWV